MALATFFALYANAQVKIGDNPNTINANSLLELESTNKGFLPPRVALNSTASVAPLTGTVTAGMLVYSTGGTLADGYYYWNGTAWRLVATSELNTVTKSATTTLTKTETFVLASGDITLTLPVVTASDNGLSITIKNVGTHTDLVTVVGSSSATIDNKTTSKLTRYGGVTYVANGGNWVIKNKDRRLENVLDVNANSSWTTLQEAVEYLNAHMSAPTVVRLDEETYQVAATLNINLSYPVTFQGPSYGHSTIAAASGLSGKPMFRCATECYFKMLQFDATTLSGYGSSANEDAIHFAGSGTYNEIKDCTFDSFYKTIFDSTNAELWIFETDISNAQHSGLMVHGNTAGVTVKVAETDFIHCARGINLDKATSATIQFASGGYYNANATDTAIVYHPTTFTSFTSIAITGNSWNNVGKYIEGFDFTRTDGRDANAILEGNAGMGDKKPYAYVTVLNNTASVSNIATANTWAKANWGPNTTSTTCKWTIVDNKITFQPTYKRNGWFTITGNLSVDGSNRVVSIGVVKNSASSTRYGETTIRTGTANQPYPFAFVVYLENISPTDYFEVYVTSSSNGDNVKIQDIQWLANAQ
ncbi:hypothetical protein A3860_30850 [Niastella vici]|uniref:Uncharacterized protein n=2 Tax=Niastella vici TaxID=1703345 RepID=A0A1V9FU86_9BACT|nr:hypothetical protein A3860_30850 [Niastella vici]